VARVGRPSACGGCGGCAKCKRAAKARAKYAALSSEERRAIVAARDPEAARERDRQRNKQPERLVHLARNARRWRKQHPERARAHSRVAYALRTGKLVKQPCEVCGSTENVHAHHDDYSKPLDVRWLCPLHHAAER
jgi:hypothetical protein